MKRALTILVAGLLLATSSGALQAARVDDRIPTIIIVERAVRDMSRLTERAEEKFGEIVERTVAKARPFASNPNQQQRAIRKFQSGSIRLQRTNFFAQRKIRQIEAKARRVMEGFDPNPEAEMMLSDAFTGLLQRMSGSLSENSARMQQLIFNPSEPQAPDEPNGLPRDFGPDDDGGDDL